MLWLNQVSIVGENGRVPLMSRSRFDQAACDQLAQCVREIEAGTDAELVIVVRARSGSYADADYLCGAILAYAGLLFILFSPWTFSFYWVAIDVALLFAVGWYVCSRGDTLRRLLTTRQRRAEAVRVNAAAMFYEAGIANTMSEMGVLVYLSLLERRLELIADRGVLRAVPPLAWNDCVFDLHKAGRLPQLQSLLEALRNLGALLAKHLPPTGENPNELSDVPRFELR
jgi:putative membrane protein